MPDPHSIDPHINLNDQPWSLPVVTQGNTMSLRYTQALDAHWRMKVQALQQRLVSNDHLAFAFGGRTRPAIRATASPPTARSRSTTSAATTNAARRATSTSRVTASSPPARAACADRGRARDAFTGRFNDEAYNLVGVGSIDGNDVVPSDPSLTSPNTDRTERSTELYLRDAVSSDDWARGCGVRHTRLHRQTAATATGSDDRHRLSPVLHHAMARAQPATGRHDMVYLSWGEGVESNVAPNTAAGQGRPVRCRRR